MSCPLHPSAKEQDCESCRADAWMGAAQMTAAGNIRLCDIALAADKLAEAVRGVLIFGPRSKWQRERLKRALQDYETVRQGQ